MITAESSLEVWGCWIAGVEFVKYFQIVFINYVYLFFAIGSNIHSSINVHGRPFFCAFPFNFASSTSFSRFYGVLLFCGWSGTKIGFRVTKKKKRRKKYVNIIVLALSEHSYSYITNWMKQNNRWRPSLPARIFRSWEWLFVPPLWKILVTLLL